MITLSRRMFLLILLLTALMPLGSASVTAQSDGTDEGLPDFAVTAESAAGGPVSTARGVFDFTLAPGQSGQAAVGVINRDPAQDLHVELFAVDGITSQGGGAAYAASGVEPTQFGQWVSITGETVTVPAGQAGLVIFTVEVPAETAPGEYLAGVSIWHDLDAHSGTPDADAESDDAGSGTEAGVKIRARYVLPIKIVVPGEAVASMEATGASVLVRPSGSWVIVDLVNTGDLFINATASFTLANQATGAVIIDEQVMIDTFVTHTATQLWFTLPPDTAPGTYALTLELEYGEGLHLSYEATVDVPESE